MSLTFCGQENEIQGLNKAEIFKKGAYHRINNDYDSALYYANLLIEFDERYGTENEILTSFHHKLNKYKFFHRTADGFSLASEVYEKYCSDSMSDKACGSCDQIRGHLVNFHIAMKDYEKGLVYLDEYCSKNHTYYFKRGKLYLLKGDDKHALNTTLECIELTKLDTSNANAHIHALNNHAILLRDMGRFEEAIEYFTQAYDFAMSSGRKAESYGYLKGNIGSCHYELGDLEKAVEFLILDSETSLTNNNIGSFVSAEIMLSEAYLSSGKALEAKTRLKNLEDNYVHHLAIREQKEMYKLLMGVYRATNENAKFQLALDQWIKVSEQHAEDVVEANKEMIEHYAKSSLEQVTLQLKTEKSLLNQKLVTEQKEKEKGKLQIWLIAAVLLIIILVSISVVIRIRKRALLKEAQLKVAKQEQEILELKVKEEHKNVQVLSSELALKKDFSKNLVDQLSQIDNISRPDLKNIEMYVQNALEIKSSRAELENELGSLGGKFHTNLKIAHPNLSRSDIEFASMIALKMSNKEMAISKSMSTDSIKTTKYRLKKKLELDSNIDLQDYLSGLFE